MTESIVRAPPLKIWLDDYGWIVNTSMPLLLRSRLCARGCEYKKKYICIQIQKHTHVYTHTYKYKLSDYEGIVKTSIPILIKCPLCARECKYKYKCKHKSKTNTNTNMKMKTKTNTNTNWVITNGLSIAQCLSYIPHICQ